MPGTDDASRRPSESEIAGFIRNQNEAALQSFAKLVQSSVGNNLFSPPSFATVGAMLFAGASEETAARWRSFPGAAESPTRQAILLAASLSRVQKALPRNAFNSGNAVVVVRPNELKPAFQKRFEEHFGGKVFDVEETGDGFQHVEAWLDRQTHGIMESQLSRPERGSVLLLNALSLTAVWSEPFEKEDTDPEPFHVAPGRTVQVPMMFGRKEEAIHLRGPSFDLLEMELAKGIVVDVVLPKDRKAGLAKLMDSLAVDDFVVPASVRPRPVAVSLPRFTITAEPDLDQFMERGLNFSEIATGSMVPTQARQFAKLEVNERGVRMAAVSGLLIVLGEPSTEPSRFIADHPFVAVVRERSTGLILMLAAVVNPRET